MCVCVSAHVRVFVCMRVLTEPLAVSQQLGGGGEPRRRRPAPPLLGERPQRRRRRVDLGRLLADREAADVRLGERRQLPDRVDVPRPHQLPEAPRPVVGKRRSVSSRDPHSSLRNATYYRYVQGYPREVTNSEQGEPP